MIFLGHLMLALIVIVGLYIGATYSSLGYEIEELEQFQKKIDVLLQRRYQLLESFAHPSVAELHLLALSAKARLDFVAYRNAENKISSLVAELLALSPTSEAAQELQACEKQFSYYKDRYNTSVANFNNRKKSLFALPVIKISKRLDHNFDCWVS